MRRRLQLCLNGLDQAHEIIQLSTADGDKTEQGNALQEIPKKMLSLGESSPRPNPRKQNNRIRQENRIKA